MYCIFIVSFLLLFLVPQILYTAATCCLYALINKMQLLFGVHVAPILRHMNTPSRKNDVPTLEIRQSEEDVIAAIGSARSCVLEEWFWGEAWTERMSWDLILEKLYIVVNGERQIFFWSDLNCEMNYTCDACQLKR